jgi:hypothetical protein
MHLPSSGLTSLGRGMKALHIHLPFTAHCHFYISTSKTSHRISSEDGKLQNLKKRLENPEVFNAARSQKLKLSKILLYLNLIRSLFLVVL